MNNKNTLAIALLSTVFWAPSALASTGCFYGETDGSQWLEQTIDLNPAVVIDYNSSRWEDVQSFQFDFGHTKIENPRSFSIRATLASATTEKQTVWGVLENVSGASGGSINAGRTELYTNLNSDRYFNELKTGQINLGLGRTGSNEQLEITKITAKFCGLVVDTGDSITVNATTYNLGAVNGEALVHYIDADTTYRVEVTGTATDESGNGMAAVSVNYIDPRKAQNVTQQLVTGEEAYLHSDGKVSLFYATGSETNTGGHTVNFRRVNLD